MPLNNYFNPSASQPAVGWQPEGFLGGMVYANREAQYNDLMSLQDQMARIASQDAQEKLNTYRADAPVRAAERPAKISGFTLQDLVNRESAALPGYGAAIGRGKMGEALQQEVKGYVDNQTKDSRVLSTNAENTVKGLESAARQLEILGAQSPLLAQQKYNEMIQTIHPQLRSAFPPAYSDEVPAFFDALSKRIQNSPEYRRRLEADRQSQESQERIAKGHDDTSRANTRYSVDGRTEAAYAKMGLKEGDVKKLEHMITQYLMKRARGEKTTPQEDSAYIAAQQIMNNARSIGADPTMFKWNFMNTPPGQPSPMPTRPVPSPVPPPGAQQPPPLTEDQRYEAWKKKNGLR